VPGRRHGGEQLDEIVETDDQHGGGETGDGRYEYPGRGRSIDRRSGQAQRGRARQQAVTQQMPVVERRFPVAEAAARRGRAPYQSDGYPGRQHAEQAQRDGEAGSGGAVGDEQHGHGRLGKSQRDGDGRHHPGGHQAQLMQRPGEVAHRRAGAQLA
jgi:hypothetical protein